MRNVSDVVIISELSIKMHYGNPIMAVDVLDVKHQKPHSRIILEMAYGQIQIITQ